MLPTCTDEMKVRHGRDGDLSQCLLFLDFLCERCGERERERDFLEDFLGVRDLDLRERLGVAEGEGDLRVRERENMNTQGKHICRNYTADRADGLYHSTMRVCVRKPWNNSHITVHVVRGCCMFILLYLCVPVKADNFLMRNKVSITVFMLFKYVLMRH